MVPLIAVLLAAANPYLDEARRLAAELEFAEALEQLKVARQVPGLERAQELELLDLTARCLVAEGRRAEAQSAYEDLLSLAPDFAPDRSLSPKILETFDAAKAKVFPPGYLKLEPLASAPGRARLRVIDPWQRAHRFELSMRVDSDPSWKVKPLELQGGAVSFELTAAPQRTLEWFVTAYDEAGAAVGGYGTAQEAQRHFVPEVTGAATVVVVRDTPRVERWPGWFAVGLGVACEVVGAAFMANSQLTLKRLDDRSQPPGDRVDTAQAAHAAAVRDATIATSLFVVGGVAGSVGVLVFAW